MEVVCMASKTVNATETRSVDDDAPASQTGAGDQDGVDLDHDLRRLRLDNEDLRFECARLKSSVAQAQAEIFALSERNGMLQRRLERLYRFAPWRSIHVIRAVLRRLGRH